MFVSLKPFLNWEFFERQESISLSLSIHSLTICLLPNGAPVTMLGTYWEFMLRELCKSKTHENFAVISLHESSEISNWHLPDEKKMLMTRAVHSIILSYSLAKYVHNSVIYFPIVFLVPHGFPPSSDSYCYDLHILIILKPQYGESLMSPGLQGIASSRKWEHFEERCWHHVPVLVWFQRASLGQSGAKDQCLVLLLITEKNENICELWQLEECELLGYKPFSATDDF